MSLYRAKYQRGAKTVGVTFFALSDTAAADFTRAWEAQTKLPVESLTRLPPSPFRNSTTKRKPA